PGPVGDRHPRRAAACRSGGPARAGSRRPRVRGAAGATARGPHQPRPGVPRAEPGGATPDRPALLPALRRVVRRARGDPGASARAHAGDAPPRGPRAPARRHGDPRPGARAHGAPWQLGAAHRGPSADGLSALDRRSAARFRAAEHAGGATQAEVRRGADRQARRAPAGAPCPRRRAHGGDRDRDQAGPRAVAVGARSLAHAARRGGGAVIVRALAGVLALWSVAAASVTDVRVDAYREAASAGAVGTVTGHAREERLKP